MTHFHVAARRWFDRSGDTYHSVRVVTDTMDATAPFTYGYGEHYLHTAGTLVIRDMPEVAASLVATANGSHAAYGFNRRWASDHGHTITTDVVDVTRRSDLHDGGKVRK